MKNPKTIILLIVSILGICLICSCFIWFVFLGGQLNLNKPGNIGTSSAKLSREECAYYEKKYDKKVYTIVGDNIKGTVGFSAPKDSCKITANFKILVNTELPANNYKQSPFQYNYIGTMHTSDQTERGNYSVGVVSPASKNLGITPEPFASSIEVSDLYNVPAVSGMEKSTWFYNSHTREPELNEQAIDKLLSVSVFEILDGLPFIEETELPSGGYSYGINHDKAEKAAKIVKSFNFKVIPN